MKRTKYLIKDSEGGERVAHAWNSAWRKHIPSRVRDLLKPGEHAQEIGFAVEPGFTGGYARWWVAGREVTFTIQKVGD